MTDHYHGYSVDQRRDRSLLTWQCMHPFCGAIGLKSEFIALLVGVVIMAVILKLVA
jgi:hypothetical protein